MTIWSHHQNIDDLSFTSVDNYSWNTLQLNYESGIYTNDYAASFCLEHSHHLIFISIDGLIISDVLLKAIENCFRHIGITRSRLNNINHRVSRKAFFRSLKHLPVWNDGRRKKEFDMWHVALLFHLELQFLRLKQYFKYIWIDYLFSWSRLKSIVKLAVSKITYIFISM